ncbi:MAG: hypothetical protein J6S81_07560 [Treponema sp.]|nr:hypothetical protein [Treponema sp.]
MLEVGEPAAQLPAALSNYGCMEEQMLNQVQHDGYKKIAAQKPNFWTAF